MGISKFLKNGKNKIVGSGSTSADDAYDINLDDLSDKELDAMAQQMGITSTELADEVSADNKDKKKKKAFSFNRGGKSDSTQTRKPNELLESVIKESEPTAAVPVLKDNKNFVFSDVSGYFLMMLPVDDPSFGGLSKKQMKDEDKGTLINLIDADDIHVVATGNLLDENVLGIVPDSETMTRLEEFSRVVNARFLPGVCFVDPDTGELAASFVPPKDGDHALGKIFTPVHNITSGASELDDFVDPEIVRVLYKIFDHPGNGYGIDGLKDSSNLLMGKIGDFMSQGSSKYPTTDDFVKVLYNNYPEIADGAFESENAGDTDDTDKREYNADSTVTQYIEPEEKSESEKDTSTDTAESQSTAVALLASKAETEDSVAGDNEDESVADVHKVERPESSDDNEDVVSDGDELPHIPGVDRDEIVNLFNQQQQISDERFAQIAQLIVQSQAERADKADTTPVAEEFIDKSYTYEDTDKELARRYLNDDLGLRIDLGHFNAAIAHKPLTIDLDTDDRTTPWLGEQLQMLVDSANNDLQAIHAANQKACKQGYITEVDSAISTIRDLFDPDNPESKYHEAFAKLKKDKDSNSQEFNNQLKAVENERRRDYQRQRDEAGRMAASRAVANFDRIYAPQLDADIRASQNKFKRQSDDYYNYIEKGLNDRRRAQAQQALDTQVSQISTVFSDMSRKHQELEKEVYDKHVNRIQQYFDDYRTEDLRRADVLDERNHKDNRAEEIRREYQARFDSINEQHEAQLAALKKDLEDSRATYTSQLEFKDKEVSEASASAQRMISSAEVRINDAEKEAERKYRAEMQHKQDTISALEAREEQYQKNMEAYKASRVQNMWVLCIVLVAMTLIGVVFGAVIW